MPLERILQLHSAALVILGAVFVSQGQETAFVPALTAVAAVVAFSLADVLGWLRLKRWVANLIVLAAVLWSLREFFGIGSEEKLIAIANMLCYVQVVLLFQEKHLRVYWQLLVLSILQVVVAAALDLGPQFALLLAVYALLALSMLLLLCIFRELDAAANRPAAAFSFRRLAAKTNAAPSALLAPPQIEPAPLTAEHLRRGLPAATLGRQVAIFASVTFLFSIAFFYATPRLSENSWLAGKSRGRSVGFQPEVHLEERGRIHLSNQVVMRVQFSRMSNRQPIMLIGEPYFHGETLTDYQYDERGGRWLPRRFVFSAGSSGYRGRGRYSSPAPQSSVSMARQDVVVEGSSTNRRFLMQPSQPLTDYPVGGNGWPRASEPEAYVVPRHRRYSYATPAISSSRQLRAIPNPNRLLSPDDGAAFGEEEQANSEFDAARFPRLAELAASIVRDHQLDAAGSQLDKAIVLEQHFLGSSRYQYTLNLDFARDEQLDPIEDFVANHRSGHCEYFASALVLMLRSQGIPARMVWGYKGGAFNSVGMYYVVQQRHAHSWVEAWVPTGDVPPGELAGPPSGGGAWYRLDPTPGRETFIALNEQSVSNRAAQAFDYVELLWRDYVLSLNRNRQEDIVYDPLNAQVGLVPSWIEWRRLRRWLNTWAAQFGVDLSPASQRRGRTTFEPLIAVLIISGLLALVGLAAALRLAIRGAQRWWTRQGPSLSHQAPPFYKRLEKILARLPATRSHGQTPRELAHHASQQLVGAGRAASAIPPEVVAAYYRIRFGGQDLNPAETSAIEQSLAQLAQAISHVSRPSSAKVDRQFPTRNHAAS